MRGIIRLDLRGTSRWLAQNVEKPLCDAKLASKITFFRKVKHGN